MIFTAEFTGDEDQVLMDIQHAMYGEMVVRLFVIPRDRYMAASRLLRVEDDFIETVESLCYQDWGKALPHLLPHGLF